MDRPNIILVTVDSWRADCVGYLNSEHDVTPAVDEFAANATLATSATAPSSHTRASVPAIMTSRYPHRFFSNFLGDTDIPTIARLLSDAGYETAAFHSNPLLSRHFGYDDGFDTFYDGLKFVESVRLPETLTRTYSKLIRLMRRYPYEPAESITRRATDWLETAQSPAFLWVHYMDPHGPYTLNRRQGYLDKFRSERLWQRAVSEPKTLSEDERNRLFEAYLGEIRYTDGYLHKLLEAIRDRFEETAIVLTGDHGEEFGEHGEFSHHAKLYEEVLRVPLVVDLPEDEDWRHPNTPISLLDVTPTLLGLVDGVNVYDMAGKDLSVLADGGNLNRSHVILETNPEDDVALCVRTDRWKYITTGDGQELYDLDEDPDETTDKSRENLEVESELKENLTEHLKEHDLAAGDKIDTAASVDNDIRNRLEQLGYL